MASPALRAREAEPARASPLGTAVLLWPLWLLVLCVCFGGLVVLGISLGRQQLMAATSIALACTRSLHELLCATRGLVCELSDPGFELTALKARADRRSGRPDLGE